MSSWGYFYSKPSNLSLMTVIDRVIIQFSPDLVKEYITHKT
nr:MAG TPA: hypothetical protein [Caudoviricetes sp.]